MKKIIFLMITLLSVASFCYGQNWRKISKQIIKEQEMAVCSYIYGGDKKAQKKNRERKKYRKVGDFSSIYHIYRMRLNLLERLNVNTQSDTLYILEMNPGLIDHNKQSTIFTRRNILSYYHNVDGECFYKHTDFKNDSLEITNKPLYPRYMLKLAIQWNLPELRKEGIKGGLVSSIYVWLTRIIFQNKKYEIDCFYFEEFLDYKRDFNDEFYYKTKDMQEILDELFSC